MDFDDHDNGDEEMGIPSYNPALSNSGRPKPVGVPDLSGGNFIRSTGSGIRYRECLKNHAVAIGGHAVDGCGEFTAAGEEGTIDALRCAACNCHRNFHRKDMEPAGGGDRSGFHSPYSPYYRMPVGYLQYNQMGMAAAVAGQQRLVAPLLLPSTSGGGQSREDQEDVGIGSGGGGVGGLGASSSSSGKKRFRSKFTQEQKNKMLAFAERVGWKIQKNDEADVQQFCEETSIKRHVFKVWMHNNKHTIGRQTIARSPPPPPPESIGH